MRGTSNIPILAHQVDITKVDQIQKMVTDLIDKLGCIDVLINNAGVGFQGQPVIRIYRNGNSLSTLTFGGHYT